MFLPKASEVLPVGRSISPSAPPAEGDGRDFMEFVVFPLQRPRATLAASSPWQLTPGMESVRLRVFKGGQVLCGGKLRPLRTPTAELPALQLPWQNIAAAGKPQRNKPRITECSGLQGTSVGHPVQPPAEAGSPRAGCTGPRPGGT